MLEKDWEKLGALPEGARPGVLTASHEGFGLVGAVVEPANGGLLERMRTRRVQLHRVTASGLALVYEGLGWLQAVDCHGPMCAAVGAALRPSGTGTDYHLVVSVDGGHQWQHRGPIPVPSIAQVLALSAYEFWVLGASYLGRTTDGGATWSEVPLTGERSPQSERLRRAPGGVALLGRGLALTVDGGHTWVQEAQGPLRLSDVEGGQVVGTTEGHARLGEWSGGLVTWGPALPEHREPLRLSTTGGTLRVLSRSAAPGRGGSDLMLHLSQDGGQTWSHHPLPTGPLVDIAGPWGLGVDAQGQVFGHLA